MASHSSTLAWKIPWTEDPGRLQSWGCEESDTTEQLHFTSNGTLRPLTVTPYFPLQLPLTTFCVYSLFWTFYMNRIIQYVIFYAWLLFIQHNVFKVPLCCTIYQYFIPFCLKILYFMNISYFGYPFIQMHLLCVVKFTSERLYHYFIPTNNDLSACFPLVSPTEYTVHFFYQIKNFLPKLSMRIIFSLCIYIILNWQ